MMYLTVNRVDLFEVSDTIAKGVDVVFETSSISGQSSVYLIEESKLPSFFKFENGEVSLPPMPHFADLIYLLVEKRYESVIISCEPDGDKIVLYIPGSNFQIEITYSKANDEFRILASENLYSIAQDIYMMIAEKITQRVVLFTNIVEKAVKEEEGSPILDSIMGDLKGKEESDEVPK